MPLYQSYRGGLELPGGGIGFCVHRSFVVNMSMSLVILVSVTVLCLSVSDGSIDFGLPLYNALHRFRCETIGCRSKLN